MMETEHKALVSYPGGNPELPAAGGKKGRKTTKSAKVNIKICQKVPASSECDGQYEKRLMRSVIDANTRACENIAALKNTRALGKQALWIGVYRGPPVVEFYLQGFNPVMGLIRQIFEYFRNVTCFNFLRYENDFLPYFRVAIETVVHRHADDYARQMQVEFDCLIAPIRHPPPEGLNYLNLRDMKTLWDYPYHRLFLATMLDVCKEYGFDKMDRHDLNLLMYGRREAWRLFRKVVDPEEGDYDVDDTVLKNVSSAMGRWGSVLLIASGSPYLALKLPTAPTRPPRADGRKMRARARAFAERRG